MTAIVADSTERASNFKTLKEQLLQVNSKIIEVNKELKTKLAEREYEKDQQKLLLQQQERFIEVKETQR